MSVKILTPPEYGEFEGLTSVFLAGTIEMGNSRDWQSIVADEFTEDDGVCFLNPRRDDWDSSWVQDISNANFRGQVEWELDHLDEADWVIIHFEPESQSPITLLELGRAAALYPEKTIVSCPEGFWRRGNVQVVCNYHDVKLVDSLEELISALKKEIL